MRKDQWRNRRRKRRRRTGRKHCLWSASATSSVTPLPPVETGWADTTPRKTLNVSKAAMPSVKVPCTHYTYNYMVFLSVTYKMFCNPVIQY